MDKEKGPVDLFPTEPTDEALQGEETLNPGFKDLIGLLIKNKDAFSHYNKKRTRNAF